LLRVFPMENDFSIVIQIREDSRHGLLRCIDELDNNWGAIDQLLFYVLLEHTACRFIQERLDESFRL